MLISRPAGCTDEHLEYLDDLRENGATNMFGAAPFLARAFQIDRSKAREILQYWMATYPRPRPSA